MATGGRVLPRGKGGVTCGRMKSCSILVVDDEDELREIVRRVLADAGHRVMTAEDGNSASRLISNEVFDLVITDVIMPERDGMQVITELRRKHPRVRVIAMSGGGHVPRAQYLKMARGLGAHAVLEKPFTASELTQAIATALSSSEDSAEARKTPESGV